MGEYSEMDKYVVNSDYAESKILDSGERRQFSTGAVRDIQEGKGRCDLLPLDVVSDLISNMTTMSTTKLTCVKTCLNHLAKFQYTKDVDCIKDAVLAFQYSEYSGSGCSAFATMILEVAKHFEEGALKYGEHNWERGIPTHCYLDSGVRHLLKWLRGDTDEPHGRAFVWNMICLIWTMTTLPTLDDLITYTWEILDSTDSDGSNHTTAEDDELDISAADADKIDDIL